MELLESLEGKPASVLALRKTAIVLETQAPENRFFSKRSPEDVADNCSGIASQMQYGGPPLIKFGNPDSWCESRI